MQTIDALWERLTFNGNRIAHFKSRVLVRADSPNLPGWYQAAPDLSALHQWPVIINGHIGQRDPLFDLGSLTGVGKIQIVLRKRGAGNGNKEKEEGNRLEIS